MFFGEKTTMEFSKHIEMDLESVDMLLVIGTSLSVQPVSKIIDLIAHLGKKVRLISVNTRPNYNIVFDAQLIGDCDVITANIARILGWKFHNNDVIETIPCELANLSCRDIVVPNNCTLFDGADMSGFKRSDV